MAATTPQALDHEGSYSSGFHGGRSLLEIAWKRKAYLVLGVVVALVVGVLIFARAEPVYRSNAQVMVVKKRPDNVTGIDTRHLAIEDYVASQQSLIHSPLIIDRAIKRYDLAPFQCFAGKEDLVEVIQKAMTVTRHKMTGTTASNVLDLAFAATNADESALVLNAVIDSYRDYLDAKYRDTSEDVLELVTKVRDLVIKDLQKKEADYARFRDEAPLLLLRGREGSSLTQEKLSTIEAKRAALLVRKAEIQSQVTAIETGLKNAGNRDALLAMISEWTYHTSNGEVARSTDRLTLQKQLLPLLEEQQKLLTTRGPNHPEMTALRQQIALARNYLASPSGAWRHSVDEPAGTSAVPPAEPLELLRDFFQQQLRHGEIAEKLLADVFKDEYDRAKVLSSYELKDERFRDDIVATRKLRDGMINRLQDVNLVKNVGGYAADVIAPPGLGKKVHPNPLLIFPAALLLGLVGGFGLAYLVEMTDKSFRSIDEVRRRLRLPVVGQIPSLRATDGRTQRALANGHVLAPILCTHFRPKSAEAESYRGVRTSLFFSARSGGHKVIQITSPDASDGKTTLAANLAVSIAQSGKKVLLIDADLRKPMVHKLFGLSAEVGLASIITAEVEPQDAVQDSGIPGLSIIPGGPLPPNPAELLTSPRFAEFLALIREQYDFVLLDTPPLLAVTDPSVVAPRVDGVILTVRLTKHGRPHAERAKDVLDTLGITVLGVVVNDVDRRASTERYGYGYGYGNDGYHNEGAGAQDDGTDPGKASAEGVAPHLGNGNEDGR